MGLRKISASGNITHATLCNVKQRKTSAVSNYLHAFHSCVSSISFRLMRMLATRFFSLFLSFSLVATAVKTLLHKALRQVRHKHVGSMARSIKITTVATARTVIYVT